ncbi:unnamed protein product [Durusdinium trenchii]|uniref:Choline transporter-like protein n=1 Tax=Durusdinium trenchii TaxID=1381693 RepID=A0ABP0Q811_9DINO
MPNAQGFFHGARGVLPLPLASGLRSYIFLLSRIAQFLVWFSLTTSMVLSGLICGVYVLNYRTGSLSQMVGRPEGSWVDLVNAAGSGAVFILLFCQIQYIRDRIDRGVLILEDGCRCIVSTPNLSLLPLWTSAFRLYLLVWCGAVVLLLFSSELHHSVSLATHNHYGADDPWSFSISFPPEKFAMMGFVVLAVYWFLMVDTASGSFIYYFFGQLFQLQTQTGAQKSSCRLMKAYCMLAFYHGGSVILAGFLTMFLWPAHLILGTIDDASSGPLGCIIESICCFLQLYEEWLAPLDLDTLQDISLQGMAYFEASNHLKKNNLSAEVRVLSTQIRFFQLAGFALAGALGYLTTMLVLQSPEYKEASSPHYVSQSKMPIHLVGAGLGLWCSLPFMRVFHLVSEGILYAKYVERQRQPKPPELGFDILGHHYDCC